MLLCWFLTKLTNWRLFEIQRAIVLVNVESGFEDLVLEKMKKVEGVEEAYISYGVYDIVIKIRADAMDDLKKIVTNRIRQISNVRATLTLLLVKD